MRIGDSDHTELNDLLESFRASLKAEKELLITAAKQFEYTLTKSTKTV
ncbi:MAG: hypothetical protein WCA39_04935 [Nitrososphaeraceae archaeon]